MIIKVESRTVKDAWFSILEKVYLEGEEYLDERGSHVRELLNVVAEIDLSWTNYYMEGALNQIKGYNWNLEKLMDYAEQFLNPVNENGFVYTYGERLRGVSGDQLASAISRLNNDEYSRRALMTTWIPPVDCGSEEVPCMILVDFKIRDGLLYTTGVWRSHDVGGAWYPNLVGLYKLSEHVKEDVYACRGLGGLTVHSISAHIYEHDWDYTARLMRLNIFDRVRGKV